MSEQLKAELAPQVVAEVQSRLKLAHFEGHKMGAAINPISLAIIEQITSAGLDTAVNMFGDAIKSGAAAVKPIIRQVVSEKVVEFLDDLVVSLKDADPSA